MCPKKWPHFYFLNNSVKNKPDLNDFCTTESWRNSAWVFLNLSSIPEKCRHCVLWNAEIWWNLHFLPQKSPTSIEGSFSSSWRTLWSSNWCLCDISLYIACWYLLLLYAVILVNKVLYFWMLNWCNILTVIIVRFLE